MKKVVLLIGSHPRHKCYASKIMQETNVVGVIEYEREFIVPVPPNHINDKDNLNFKKHFELRENIEKKYFPESIYNGLIKSIKKEIVNVETFNSIRTASIIKEWSPDIVFVFGTTLITDVLFNVLPKYTINLHLGLSPWYKGAATLFWPFYFLEPQMAGSTFHIVTPKIDAGPIISQCVPKLEYGDGVHDVSAKVVMESSEEAIRIVELLEECNDLELHNQKGNGKLFLVSDFKAQHLRLIYDIYSDRIVDSYLDGCLPGRHPHIIKLPSS